MATDQALEAMPEHNPAPPEIISERFRGLMITIEQFQSAEGALQRQENNSKLYYRLDRALDDLVYGLLQHDVDRGADDIRTKLHDIVRRESIRLVVENGSACWDDPEHAKAFEDFIERRRAAGFYADLDESRQRAGEAS